MSQHHRHPESRTNSSAISGSIAQRRSSRCSGSSGAATHSASPSNNVVEVAENGDVPVDSTVGSPTAHSSGSSRIRNGGGSSLHGAAYVEMTGNTDSEAIPSPDDKALAWQAKG